jgi:hypothetical protein
VRSCEGGVAVLPTKPNLNMTTQYPKQNEVAALLTRKELAHRWKASTETLKRRERAGILPFLKLGRGVRYRISDVEALERAAYVA